MKTGPSRFKSEYKLDDLQSKKGHLKNNIVGFFDILKVITRLVEGWIDISASGGELYNGQIEITAAYLSVNAWQSTETLKMQRIWGKFDILEKLLIDEFLCIFDV